MTKQVKARKPTTIKRVAAGKPLPATVPVQREEPSAIVLEMALPLMYASKNAEYVFGAEVGDGFVTLTIPKDRFAEEPKALMITATSKM